jgi:hypothetical protein
MRAFLASLLTTFLLTTVSATERPSSALVWEQERILLSVLPGTESVEAVFLASNRGPAPVRITRIATNCGCTASAAPENAVKVGEEVRIPVKFTVGDRRGLQMTTVVIHTDEDGVAPQTLRLDVDIQSWLTIEPRILLWRGDSATRLTTHIQAADTAEVADLTAELVPNSGLWRIELEKPQGPDPNNRRWHLSVTPLPQSPRQGSVDIVLRLKEGSEFRERVFLVRR